MAQVFHGPSKTLHGYNGAGRSPKLLTYEKMEGLLKEQGLNSIPVSHPVACDRWALFERLLLIAGLGAAGCVRARGGERLVRPAREVRQARLAEDLRARHYLR